MGIAAPWAAPRVASLLLAIVAAFYLAIRLRDVISRLPAADDRPLRSPPPPRPGTPADLTMLTAKLATAQSTNVLSPAVTECVHDLAAVRLQDHHGLNIRDPWSHDAIRPLVSDELWTVLARWYTPTPRHRIGPDTGAIPLTMPVFPTRLTYASLPALIDEVERL